ncbi:pantothenate kinase [Sphaerospermopsis aphanizomenoides BCCUSP55]|uniref:pantothenate kinase n=1 Tax=Sphaerospermopsis aphanizomenoides TaxID=459663 RepID=UPI0019071BEE|nr:pantothenate kinase [Sphaerospermopsis aphanizomenoides]MBK1987983.1 pantothenate kinase [Sphaerospermopsis aphanizomenoides BCCUSP55]
MKQNTYQQGTDNLWLGLMIGNSRLHWALFVDNTLNSTWDTDHLSASDMQKLAKTNTLPLSPSSARPMFLSSNLPITLVLASVVPSQTKLWQTYPNVRLITLNHIPIQNMYSSLGVDRALALYGAGKTYGFPMLVIDAGTAITFTGVDNQQYLVGGAILPGLSLQLNSLGQNTGQLPLLKTREIVELPPRFSLDTKSAIQSGIIYILLAGIKDFIDNWLLLFPDSKIAITGGDSELLKAYLIQQFTEIGERLIIDKNLIFRGMWEVYFV